MSTLTLRTRQDQLSLFPELDEQRLGPPPLQAGSKVIVSCSGGKDSIACLLRAIEIYGCENVIVHHQRIPEDWPRTLDYIQVVCARFRVSLYVSQAHYTGYACATCQTHYCYKAQGMTDEEMYERDVEGGPRMSCVICFLKPEEQLRASYNTEEGRYLIERGIRVEREIGHTLQRDRSLEGMVAPVT